MKPLTLFFEGGGQQRVTGFLEPSGVHVLQGDHEFVFPWHRIHGVRLGWVKDK